VLAQKIAFGRFEASVGKRKSVRLPECVPTVYLGVPSLVEIGQSRIALLQQTDNRLLAWTVGGKGEEFLKECLFRAPVCAPAQLIVGEPAQQQRIFRPPCTKLSRLLPYRALKLS